MRYSEQVKRLLNAIQQPQGHTAPELRRTIVARAASTCGTPCSADSFIAAPLSTVVDKIARDAYSVTDQDISDLKKAGYSEPAIFEVIVCAAAGAGIGRLECGLAALKEGQHAPESCGSGA